MEILYFSTFPNALRSDGSEMDYTLDYQSRDRKIDPRFPGLSDETLNRGPVSVWPRCWWDVIFHLQEIIFLSHLTV